MTMTDWRDKFIEKGLTFSDISLRPQYSVLETRAGREGGPSIKTRLTPKIELAIPIISANMDTVTESNMAIAMAKFGGIGIIHRNCSVEYQVREVEKVKRAEEGLIREPYTLSPENSIDRARVLMAEKQVDSVLIVGLGKKLVGLLTKYELAGAGGFEAVGKHMKPLQKLIVVKTEINIDEDEAEKLARKTFDEHPFLGKLPFIDEEGRLIGFVTKKSLLRRAEYPDATRDENGRLRVGAAVGVDEDALRRADALLIADADILVLDVAHGHAKKPMEMAKIIRKRYPDCQLMVGNVATLEAVRDYARLGVDAIKVGIGPGAVCSTRIVTGAGVPQVSAILECARAAEISGIPIIADGGIRYPRDVAIAIACGASAVMIGTLFAGTDESPGDIIEDRGRTMKLVRGMSSLGVNLDIKGDNFIKAGLKDAIQPEGVLGQVPYRGPLARVLRALVAGLRSGMTYTGSATIKDLQEPIPRKFSRVSRAAWEESNPHDVEII
jgi:IMP dehydrogenase